MALTCRVVTPDTTFFDGEAKHLTVPAWDGEMGFQSNHAPLIARLGYGVLTIHADGQPIRIAIFGGFVKVHGNVCIVLAGGAEEASKIDLSEAQRSADEIKAALDKGRSEGATELEISAMTERLMRADARLAAVQGAACPIYKD
jgi:F-type H+-transporting ATPase subunit epsilon